jgi:hypothetical protein
MRMIHLCHFYQSNHSPVNKLSKSLFNMLDLFIEFELDVQQELDMF